MKLRLTCLRSIIRRVVLGVILITAPSLCDLVYAQNVRNTSGNSTFYGIGDVVYMSAIGHNPDHFTPLTSLNFGEGWFEPWIPPPNGELHLQRGGWVNTASGFFSREIDPAFSFFAGTSGTRDEYVGATSLFVPFNRRFQLGVFVPFVDSLQGTGTLSSATSFGDVVVTPQVMLEETETLSLSALLAIRTPTGETKTHNDRTILTPSLAVWQDLPAGWQWRGGIGADFATHGGEGFDEIFDLNLAAGNTLTGHEAAPFGDLTPYLSANLNQFLGRSSRSSFTNFSLTPGIRFFLGWHTYFISGVGVPVTNPKPFLPSLTVVISRGW